MQINTLNLGGRNGSCACLPAGQENAVFIASKLAELQKEAGPDGFGALIFVGSPKYYHNASNLKPAQLAQLRNHLLRLRLQAQLSALRN